MIEIEIWTDGGIRKRQEVASWAYILYYPKYDIAIEKYGIIHGNPTSQIAELTAARNAIKAALDHFGEYKNVQFKLFSDSQYFVKGMNEWLPSWKSKGWRKSDNQPIANLHFWKEFDRLKTKYKNITYNWVKGHAGIEMNERVDGLCQLALEEHRNSAETS